jgi:hypothetical protein
MPRLNVGHRASKVCRRGSRSGRDRRSRNRREVVEITPRQYVAASDGRARAISDPARCCIKVTSKVAREVKCVNGNQTDVAGRNVKHVVQSQLVASGHGDVDRATANSRHERTTKPCNTLRRNGAEGLEISASRRNMTRSSTVKNKRKTRREGMTKRRRVGRGKVFIPIKITMLRTGGKRRRQRRRKSQVRENMIIGIIEIL